MSEAALPQVVAPRPPLPVLSGPPPPWAAPTGLRPGHPTWRPSPALFSGLPHWRPDGQTPSDFIRNGLVRSCDFGFPPVGQVIWASELRSTMNCRSRGHPWPSVARLSFHESNTSWTGESPSYGDWNALSRDLRWPLV